MRHVETGERKLEAVGVVSSVMWGRLSLTDSFHVKRWSISEGLAIHIRISLDGRGIVPFHLHSEEQHLECREKAA